MNIFSEHYRLGIKLLIVYIIAYLTYVTTQVIVEDLFGFIKSGQRARRQHAQFSQAWIIHLFKIVNNVNSLPSTSLLLVYHRSC